MTLEQAFDLACVVQVNGISGGHTGQTRHGHDLTADNNHEPGTRAQTDFAHGHRVACGRAALGRIG